MTDWSDPATAAKILTTYKTWAVVGCSSDPRRASFRVFRYLASHGFETIPVNPKADECQGRRAYPDLRSIGADFDVEVVDIFRRSELAGPHVDEAIEIGAKAIWMQLDVIDEDAAERAAAAGLDVVMNRCPAIDGPQVLGQPV